MEQTQTAHREENSRLQTVQKRSWRVAITAAQRHYSDLCSLDSYARYTRAASKQWELPFSTNLIPISQEGSTRFTVNIADGSDLIWSPSRYALRNLSIDIDDVANAFVGNPAEKR